jgi:hypothetical protein
MLLSVPLDLIRNEPTEVSLGFQASLRFVAHQQLKTMDPTTPLPLDFDHKPGFEIPTKHKEAIRQLHGFAGKSIKELMDRYKLSKSSIVHILLYKHPEHT